LVIIVDCDSFEGIVYAKALGAVFDVEKFLRAFVDGHDFGSAGALGGLIFSDGVPGNGTAATDEVAGERLVLEEFDRGTIGASVTNLSTPVCITESFKLMDLGWRGRSSVRVCLFVVMMSKVVE